MSNVKSKNELMTVVFDVNGREVKLSPEIVRNFLTNGAELSDGEYKFFVEICQARNLNPFLKEVYPIKYGTSPAQIVVSKEAILKRAVNHKDYEGHEKGIIVVDTNGNVVERIGTFRLKEETLVGGWAITYRKGRKPLKVTVSFDEVAQKTGQGNLNSNWATKGATMVEKVAMVRSMRETFVEDLGGLIDEDEAWIEKEKETGKQKYNEQQNNKDEIHVVQDEPILVDTNTGEVVEETFVNANNL